MAQRAKLTASRRGIRQDYSFLPLHLMADFFAEQELPLKTEIYDTYQLGRLPANLVAKLKAHAQGATGSTAYEWERIDPELANLRRAYLHLSFESTVANYVRLTKTYVAGYARYRPEREVHDG